MDSLCVMCGFESVKNQRRVLHSTSTVHVLPLLRRLVRDEIDDAPSHVLCMRCFRLLDKCFKLKRELDLAEEEAMACVRVRSDTATPVSVMVQHQLLLPCKERGYLMTRYLINCHQLCR